MSVSTGSSQIQLGEKSSALGVVRTDEELAKKNLSDVEEEVANADDFIVYGRASVEIFDDDVVSQKIQMDAFEESLDQFFAQGGNISYKHKDVFVGEALESYELESNVSIQIGDEEHEFEAGETLETKVEDDTLWLVANIYGRNDEAGSDASLMTRLGAYRGELDGFSVTIKNKEYQNTDGGQVITEIDFHSVTVGSGDEIKNPDSLFGVAEFKLGDIIDDALTINPTNMELNILKKLRESSTEALGEETITHALSETYSLSESAKAVADEGAVEDVEAKAESRLAEVQEKADSREDLVSLLSDMTDLSSDEVNEALDEMLEDDTEEKETHDGEEMEEDEEEDNEEKASVEDEAQAIADQMDVPVSRVMEMLSALEGDAEEVEEEEEEVEEDEDEDMEQEADAEISEEDVEAIVDEKLDSMMEDVDDRVDKMEDEVAERVSERIAEKMESGSTPEQDANPAEDDSENLLKNW